MILTSAILVRFSFRQKNTKPGDFQPYMEGKRSRFVESSEVDIKKLVASAVPESSKKLTKYHMLSSAISQSCNEWWIF